MTALLHVALRCAVWHTPSRPKSTPDLPLRSLFYYKRPS
jgi:hypothetical protein